MTAHNSEAALLLQFAAIERAFGDPATADKFERDARALQLRAVPTIPAVPTDARVVSLRRAWVPRVVGGTAR